MITVVSLAGLLLALPMVPMRLIALIIAWTPFLLLHPFSRAYLPAILAPYMKKARMRMARMVDDDRLEDRHWRSELREVELWENERYSEKEKGFSKASLKAGERKAWTRGKDGWSDEGPDGNGDVRSGRYTERFTGRDINANLFAAAT